MFTAGDLDGHESFAVLLGSRRISEASDGSLAEGEKHPPLARHRIAASLITCSTSEGRPFFVQLLYHIEQLAEGETRMSGNGTAKSQAIRARLNHPVIDSDGHWREYEPLAMDYLREEAGPK